MPASTPADEARRLGALQRYEILDTPPDPALDDITALAARVCGTRSARVVLVDANRVWIKSAFGPAGSDSLVDATFCRHAMHPPRALLVPDASRDARFASDAAVKGDGGLRLYGAAPLLTPNGEALGALAVMDSAPGDLSRVQMAALETLARGAMTHLELRRQTRETARAEGAMLDLLREQQETEEMLRSREQRYRLLFAHNPTPMWVFDLDTLHFLAVNAAAVEHYGYSEAEFLNMTIADIRDAADVPVLMSTIVRLQRAERSHVTTRHRKKDGTFIEVEIVGDFIVFDGRRARIVVVNDVTARVAAERMMRESEERFRLLSKATNDAIRDWDLVSDTLWWNDGYFSLFGYTRSDAPIGPASWMNSIVPGDRDRVVERLQRAIEDGAESWWDEYRFTRADGTHAYVLDRGYVIRDARGRAIRMIGGMTDLTSRREAEEQIAAQAALLNEAKDAILLMDLHHRVLFWNRGAEHLYGWSPGEAIGQIDTLLHQVDSPAYREAHARLLQSGRWEGTLEHQTRLGELLTVESRWALTRDVLGQPKSILILSTDVTERKRNEAHHLRAQRMESIGTLAGGIAHDLNNLLSPMMMSVDLLRESCTDQDSLDLLRTVQMSAARGADLVQQVLSFARGVEGERVPVSPVTLVRELQKIIRDSFPKSVRVAITHDDALWSVVGDATQLHQVLLNLCINARDAMPDGGKLSIDVGNAEIDDVYAAHNPDARVGDYVVFSLADTGVGISPSVRDRIFEPFFSTKDVGRGTGLGLSTSMAIVRSHGGFISLYSEPGSGTTFRVYLPANRAQLALAEVPRPVPVMARGNGELVLVVDDEAPIRRIAQRTLERYGYRVLTAANGAEATAIYAERGADIDLVLTDMAMPVMDGPALITALRELDPQVRIIGSSGLASVDGIEDGLGQPLSQFVPKPYTAETMLRAVRDALHVASRPP